MKPGLLGWRTLILGVLLASSVLAQRVFVGLQTGEVRPAIVELLPLGMALLALVVTMRARARNLDPLFSRGFVPMWGPYLALALVLPVLGVATGLYQPRSLAALLVPIFAISAMVLGGELAPVDGRGLAGWARPLMVAAVLVAAYAVLQQLLVGGLLPSGPWDSLLSWDVSTQQAYGPNVVLGRSSAFYTNPNILGAAAGTMLLISVFVTRKGMSYAIVAAAFGALVLSQSRGAAVALVVSLAFVLLVAIRRGRPPTVRSLLPYAGVVIGVLAAWLLLVSAGAPADTLIGRIGQGIGVISGGSDPNVTGRLQFWEAGLRLLGSHPLGTFGPPEQLLGSAVDSDWVRALLQGSLPFALALALALIGGALLVGDDGPERRLVRALSVFMAVAAITQLPLEYPSAYLYWAIVGAAAVAAARRSGRVAVLAGGSA